MSRQADVSSIDSVRRFRAALQEYGETVDDVVAALQVELQRAINWLEQDRMNYWPAEVRKANDKLVEALNRLEMKQLTIDRSDSPSCYDEKKAVERAKLRLRFAEDKVSRTRHWMRIVKHETEEFRGMLAKVGYLSESEIPRAVAALGRMTEALEKYARQNAPLAPDRPARGSGTKESEE